MIDFRKKLAIVRLIVAKEIPVPNCAERFDNLGLVFTQPLERDISDLLEPVIPPLEFLLNPRRACVLQRALKMGEAVDELTKLLYVAFRNSFGDLESFEDVEPLESGGELRFEDADEVSCSSLGDALARSRSGVTQDRTVGSAWGAGRRSLRLHAVARIRRRAPLGLER